MGHTHPCSRTPSSRGLSAAADAGRVGIDHDPQVGELRPRWNAHLPVEGRGFSGLRALVEGVVPAMLTHLRRSVQPLLSGSESDIAGLIGWSSFPTGHASGIASTAARFCAPLCLRQAMNQACVRALVAAGRTPLMLLLLCFYKLAGQPGPRLTYNQR